MALRLVGYDDALQSFKRFISTSGGDPEFELPTGKTFRILDESAAPLFVVGDDGALTLGKAGVASSLAGDLVIDGDLTVNGTQVIINTELQTADDFILMNSQYTADTPKPAGLVLNINPESTSASVDTGGFSSSTEVEIDTDLGLSSGDFILVTGANNPENDGIYEVASQSGGGPYTVAVKSSPTANLGLGTGFTTDATVEGTVVQTSLTWLRAKAAGGLETATANASGSVSFSDLATGGSVSLQGAYNGGPGITLLDSTGDLTITLDETGTEADFVVTGTGQYLATDAANDKLVLGASGAIGVESANGLTLLNAGLTMTGLDIGAAAAEIGDIYVADDKDIYFGNDQDAKLGWDTGEGALTFATGPVLFNDVALTTEASTLAASGYQVNVNWAAGDYTGSPGGIVVDYSGMTSYDEDATYPVGCSLIGVTNAGTGLTIGLGVSGFDMSASFDAAVVFNSYAQHTYGGTPGGDGYIQLSDEGGGAYKFERRIVVSSAGTAEMVIKAVNGGAGEAHVLVEADDYVGITDGTTILSMDGGVVTWTGCTSFAISAGAIDLNPTDIFTLDMAATKTAIITLSDDLADAFLIQEGANAYLDVTTTNFSEKMEFGNATTNPDFEFLGTGDLLKAGEPVGTWLNTTSGEAIAAGELVCIDDATGSPRTFKADADGAGERINAIGYAMHATSGAAETLYVGQSGQIAVPDAEWDGGVPGTGDVGKLVYMSTTAGSWTLTTPSTPGDSVLIVGIVAVGGSGAVEVAFGLRPSPVVVS